MSTQREPKGIPAGGRFAISGLDEADFELKPLTDDEYNEQGSFSFPPPPRSLGQVARFWQRVQISDNILLRMCASYEGLQGQMRADAVTEHARANPEPPMMKGKNYNPAYQVWLDGQNAEQAAVDAAHPRSIPPQWARGIARATMMYKQAVELDTNMIDEEDSRAYDYERGGGPNAQRVLLSSIDFGAQGQWQVSDALEMFPTMNLDEDVWYDQQVRDLSVIAQSVSALD